jgi:hypothetical protein
VTAIEWASVAYLVLMAAALAVRPRLRPWRRRSALTMALLLAPAPIMSLALVSHGLGVKFLLFLAATWVGGLGAVSWKRDSTIEQRERDARATEVLSRVEADTQQDIPRFALYLRWFGTTDHLATQPVNVPGREIDQHTDLETLLHRALYPLPLVALGRPGEMYGAGRVPADEKTWQGTVARLALAATTILVIPAAHPGTLWELAWLKRSHCLAKTVLIMPQDPHAPSGHWIIREGPEQIFGTQWEGGHTFDYAGEWASARASAGSLGLALPAYEPQGMLFALDDDGSLRDQRPLSIVGVLRQTPKLRASLAGLLGQARP